VVEFATTTSYHTHFSGIRQGGGPPVSGFDFGLKDMGFNVEPLPTTQAITARSFIQNYPVLNTYSYKSMCFCIATST
jgi:hypothetical protein